MQKKRTLTLKWDSASDMAWSLQVQQPVNEGIWQEKDQKTHPLTRKNDNAIHLLFRCSYRHMTALVEYSIWGLSSTNQPTATPSCDAPDIAISCCVNGATAFCIGIIWAATTLKCANLIKPIGHWSRSAVKTALRL